MQPSDADIPSSPPKHTSSLAALSLLFSLAPFFGSLPAICLGALALLDLRRHGHRYTGKRLALAGLTLGVINAALVGVFMWRYAEQQIDALASTPPIAPTLSPPAITPGSPPPTTRSRGDEEGQMTVIESVVEARIGSKITLVDLPATIPSLATELQVQDHKATSAHEKLLIYTVTDSCRPCLSVGAVLGDPKMQSALANVRLVRVNAREMRMDLEDLGMQTRKNPGFYLLGPDMRARDGITGGEWDEDTADNIAPILEAFVNGRLTSRREKLPIIPPRRARPNQTPARPAPTML